MSFLFELDPKDEAAADLVAEVGKKLQRALEKSGISQNEIAQRLDVDRSRVSKCLSGFNNLTLKTVAELSWAMGANVRFEIGLPERQVQTAPAGSANIVSFIDRQDLGQQEQGALRTPLARAGG